MKTIILVAILTITIPSMAQMQYTAQDRHVLVMLAGGSQRSDAVDFAHFADAFDVQDFASRAIAEQDSSLAPMTIQGSLRVFAQSLNLQGSARSESRLYVEFTLPQVTPFVLDGDFYSAASDSVNTFAYLRLDGPTGSVFNYMSQTGLPIVHYDFTGANALHGILQPGHYTLDASMVPQAAAGNRYRDGRILFTLTVPSAATSIPLLSALLLARRRRREPG